MSLLYDNEKNLVQQFGLVAGVDEAGRGPLAGPLVTAACILDLNMVITGLNDSKIIVEKKRDKIYEEILQAALDYRITVVPVCDIDRLNILGATMQGMEKAVNDLQLKPDLVIIDGNRIPVGLKNARPVVKGDGKYASIAAASVLAKVTRDRIMKEIHYVYPRFNFLKNKGYPTKEHIKALREFGITEHHRKTYYPVRMLGKTEDREKLNVK